ncbi:Nostrin [Acropora cervicornis]|uniref:Nostrin n=1 Tax=Acropora cervicornis TaxID=6130 RepID=A0AAD9V4U6_ACRCE|nr:Nostrin [Acropora cervicornis]
MTKFEDSFWEQKGYEELRKLCRQGNEFCRDVSSIFNERSKIEQSYADNLSKLAQKAQKTSKDVIGTLKSSWESTILEMEKEAEIHRQSGTLTARPRRLRLFVNRLKRQEVEEGPKLCLTKISPRHLDSKSRKLADSSVKADREYRELYEKTEKARLEWDTAMLKFCKTSQKLEEERLTHLREMCSLYSNMLSALVPQLQQNFDNVGGEVWKINPSEDVVMEANLRGEPRGPSEQILYDCYEEDLEMRMNFERRKTGLERKIKLLSESLAKEKKTRAAYADTPDYCSEEGQQDVATQLEHGILQSVLRIPLDQVTRVDVNSQEGDDRISILGQCRALYEYKAAQSDELDLKPGDVITLTAKLEGGWWEGELGDKSGVFPASYVEEIQ